MNQGGIMGIFYIVYDNGNQIAAAGSLFPGSDVGAKADLRQGIGAV